MHISREKRRVLYVLGAVLVVVGIIVSCLGMQTPRQKTIHVDGLVAQKTLHELTMSASVITKANVVSKSEPFRVKNANGAVSIFTDYYISPIEIIKGEAVAKREMDDSSMIRVRLEGGSIEELTVLASQEPTLTMNEQYVFFLSQPQVGGGFTVDDGSFEITGVNQGVFELVGEEEYVNLNGEYIDIGRMPFSVEELKVDEDYYKKEFLENQKRNLASGFITQEEYDQAITEMDRFAMVVHE